MPMTSIIKMSTKWLHLWLTQTARLNSHNSTVICFRFIVLMWVNYLEIFGWVRFSFSRHLYPYVSLGYFDSVDSFF